VACFAQLKQPVRHFGVSEIPNGLEAARKEQTANSKLQMFAADGNQFVSRGVETAGTEGEWIRGRGCGLVFYFGPLGAGVVVSASSVKLSATPQLIIHPKVRA